MQDETDRRPALHVLPGRDKRWRHGHPWLYSNELRMDDTARGLAPGSTVRLIAADDRGLGVATFNPHTLIAARRLSGDPEATIDRSFLSKRLQRALALRSSWYADPWYRLIHAEADGLPGLVVDRYGDLVVIQANTAGMERLLPDLLPALDEVVAPATVVLRNDSGMRTLEGLPQDVQVVKGRVDGPVPVMENGARFFADPVGGQKTGWFFDQRENRATVARLCRNGGRVLDLFCYAGGFSVLSALRGAESVLGLDGSEPALTLARMAAAANGVDTRCTFRRTEVFEEMDRLAAARERFDLVIADPPAFIKSKKDIPAGTRAYRKLVRLGARLTRPGGHLLVASCSHNLLPERFAEEVAGGLLDANREGRIVHGGAAAPDHPVHPQLPESAYLKVQILQVD